MCSSITCNDATRRRRYSPDEAKRRWYAGFRAMRFRDRYFGGYRDGGLGSPRTSEVVPPLNGELHP